MPTRGNPDYESKVPTYVFPPTLLEQEAALRSNPMVARFRKSRRVLGADRYRPAYHYVNPENHLNDPNGLCFWNGRWHLFYQGYPPEDPRVHWGHAVSDDLIHWQDLPYAIYPNPEHHCFSGATLVEDDRVIAMYHGTMAGNMVAVSSDPLLLNWEKLGDGPVIPLAGEGEILPYNVFDPCIWKRDGYYYALSAGTLPHRPSGRRTRADFLFRSHDLTRWEYLHPFVEEDLFGYAGDDGACPYFWPIGGSTVRRHLLLHFSHMSGGKYILGDYDEIRDKLVARDGGRFNFGAYGPGGVHAPSATTDGSGGVIVIFNMNEGRSHEGWGGIMTLPRRLTLLDGDQLGVEPAGEIASVRTGHRAVGPTVLPPNEEIVLPGVEGDAIEIDAEIEVGEAPMVELNVLRAPGKEEYTRIAFYKQRGFRHWERYGGWEPEKLRAASDSLITIDTSYSSTGPDVRSRAPETAPVYVAPQEPLRLRVFVDRSVVEVFVNGRQCAAVRVYPARPDSVGVSLRAQGQEVVVSRLDVWKMAPIF